MASRRLALIGATEGPWIDISRIKNPILKIIGLMEGEVNLVMKNDHRRDGFTFNSNGERLLDQGFNWAQVSATKAQRSLMCEIISARTS